MRFPGPRPRRAWALLPAALCAAAVSGCAWQPYVVTRAVRYGTGLRTRVHAVVPLEGHLARYRVIEVHPFENLLPDHMPPGMAAYLNGRIASALHAVRSAPRIVVAIESADGSAPAAADDTAPATLLLEGDIDDYDPGSFPLRVVELGFNHIAVTARVRLRDKRSGRVVAAASITVQDDRATGTGRGAIDHLAKRITTYVSAGYGE